MVVVACLLAVAIVVALRPAGCSTPSGAPEPPRSALILNSAALAQEGQAGRLRVEGVEAVFRTIEDLAMVIETGSVRVYETVGGRDLADFGLVQVAAYPPPTATLLNVIAAYLEDRKVRGINLTGVGAPTKLLQYLRLAQAGLQVPATRYVSGRLLLDAYPGLADQLGLPFILKALRGGGGRPDALVTSHNDFADRLREADSRRSVFLAREFIPSETALHLLVLGDQVPVVIQRTGFDLNPASATPERVALIKPAAIDPAARRLATRAAAVMGFEIAGVDLVQHWTTGQWHVLEVSATPAIGSGAFASDTLSAYSAYLKRRTRRKSAIQVTSSRPAANGQPQASPMPPSGRTGWRR